ncbi:S16 family serine protease [Archaeoglobus profundus]|uniref:Serine protease-like protein n=1 Tax=Archaeoglobus profundus (strain DSM 5631 / JCM 9629 / NBRC 100127 / Av18) TaxID=572546 RepID=D2RGA3_ARCPA|nr:S16 family serine protease [Archaeoglobus profundus]ADB57328.1 serine protease-like protein [Archaeoglobus profundus DSM 5631]
MKKAVILLLAFMLIIFPVNAKTVNIKAVAVKSGEKPEGAVIDITVTVTDGEGKVFVSTSPYTEIDMQGSAQLAALTACDLLGLDFTKYNFYYEIEADAPIVGGPSAGGVMTVATICVLKNLTPRSDVFMTGMIYPDGYIGPVGGIPYKLEAAAKSGAKIFLIPEGQRIVYITKTVEEKKGPFVFIRQVTEPVDVVELGKNLGVKVIEVETIEQALWYYTGYTISKPQLKINLAKYSDILKILATKMENETINLRNVVGEVKEADELIEKAKRHLEERYYYTATSEFFQAKIILRKEYYSKTLKSDEDLENAFKDVESEIAELKNYLREVEDNVGVESFQIVGAGEERVAWAEKYLENAKASGNWYSAIDYLALAKERVESAKVWLSLLQTIEEDVPLNKGELKKRTEFYIRIVQSLIVYANSVGGYSNLIDRAEQSLQIAQNLYNDGFYSGAQIACMDSMVEAGLAVELIAPSSVFEDILKSKLERVEKAAETSIAEIEQAVTPILPVAYFEFAKSYYESYMSTNDVRDAVYALIYYKLSERLAKVMLLVSKAYEERQIIKTEIPPFTPSEYSKTSIERIEYIEVPGYSALVCVIAVGLAYYKRKKSRR